MSDGFYSNYWLLEDYGEYQVYRCGNCDSVWQFDQGTPAENGFRFCPGCGTVIIEFESITATQLCLLRKLCEEAGEDEHWLVDDLTGGECTNFAALPADMADELITSYRSDKGAVR